MGDAYLYACTHRGTVMIARERTRSVRCSKKKYDTLTDIHITEAQRG
jgi:hypothetical protein